MIFEGRFGNFTDFCVPFVSEAEEFLYINLILYFFIGLETQFILMLENSQILLTKWKINKLESYVGDFLQIARAITWSRAQLSKFPVVPPNTGARNKNPVLNISFSKGPVLYQSV